jgi:pimeloyl-ACP methyl ester carboxylesterase
MGEERSVTETVVEETVRIADRLDVLVRREGAGPPLLFLHSSGGIMRDVAFLRRIAERHQVIQPAHPGWPGSEAGLELIDTPVDMALHYGDLIRDLGLPSPLPVLGYSIGGMFAAELAAVEPSLVSKLVLIDAVGVWVEEAPMADFFCYAPDELPGLSFYDPDSEVARETLAPSGDEQARLRASLERTISLAAAGKFLWASPDRGLSRRLYRIQAPTLVLHGKQDRLSPVKTAYAFAAGIRDARVAVIDRAGHAAIREQVDACLRAVLEFLAS